MPESSAKHLLLISCAIIWAFFIAFSLNVFPSSSTSILTPISLIGITLNFFKISCASLTFPLFDVAIIISSISFFSLHF